jgi:hypothetical protein
MSKIAYTVTCHILYRSKAEEWLEWLKNGHVAAVIKGGAESAVIVAHEDGKTFEVRYIFPDQVAFDTYETEHAFALRQEGLKLFPPADGFHYTRSVGAVVGTF